MNAVSQIDTRQADPVEKPDIILGDDWDERVRADEPTEEPVLEKRRLIALNRSPLARKIITFNLLALVVLVGGILYLNQSRVGLVEQRERGLTTEARLMARVFEAKGGADALAPDAALEQEITLSLGEGASLSARTIQLILLITVLSIAPGLAIMITCFPFLVTVLAILRQAIGLQQSPPNMLIVSLALFLTFFLMSPTVQKALRDGVQLLVEQKIDEKEAADRIVGPFREFMAANVRESDVRLLQNLRPGRIGNVDGAAPDITILVPAFMISELRRGFEIGFLVALPFLVIDLIVATITMSMGMMMLPPSVIGLPIKVLFFVLIDGWSLLVSGLVRSYGA